MDIGDVVLISKDYTKALSESKVELKLYPNEVGPLKKKILALVGLREYKNALTCCDQMIKIEPINGYLMQGYVFLRFNNYKNALKASNELIKLDKTKRKRTSRENCRVFGGDLFL